MPGKKQLAPTGVPVEAVDGKRGAPIADDQLTHDELGVYPGAKL